MNWRRLCYFYSNLEGLYIPDCSEGDGRWAGQVPNCGCGGLNIVQKVALINLPPTFQKRRTETKGRCHRVVAGSDWSPSDPLPSPMFSSLRGRNCICSSLHPQCSIGAPGTKSALRKRCNELLTPNMTWLNPENRMLSETD